MIASHESTQSQKQLEMSLRIKLPLDFGEGFCWGPRSALNGEPFTFLNKEAFYSLTGGARKVCILLPENRVIPLDLPREAEEAEFSDQVGPSRILFGKVTGK